MTAGVFEDAVDGARERLRIPGKCLNRGLARVLDCGPAQAVEAAAVGSQPKSTLGILRDGGDGIVGEPLLYSGVAESPVAQAAQPARCPDPEVTAPRVTLVGSPRVTLVG